MQKFFFKMKFEIQASDLWQESYGDYESYQIPLLLRVDMVEITLYGENGGYLGRVLHHLSRIEDAGFGLGLWIQMNKAQFNKIVFEPLTAIPTSHYRALVAKIKSLEYALEELRYKPL